MNCRLRAAGIRCPAPLLLRLHVLVMEFIGIALIFCSSIFAFIVRSNGEFRFMTGKAGWAAPRLKDAALSLDKLREGYVEVGSDISISFFIF